MSRLLSLFDRFPVVTDGAMATQLFARGLSPQTPPCAWNLERPDLVEEVARSYVAAGSQVLLTNTFRADAFTHRQGPLRRQIAKLNQSGVQISRRAAAAGEKVRVFGSVGPILFNEPVHQADRKQIQAAYSRQMRWLTDAGVDGLVLETFGDIEQAKLACDAALKTGLPAILSFSFGPELVVRGLEGPINVEEVVRQSTTLSIDSIGANCGTGTISLGSLATRIRSVTNLPIWLKPNAGPVLMVAEEPPVAEWVDRLIDASRGGISLMGGCCGTTPQHLRALTNSLLMYD
jgi:5-methyltetrahydrofolate--homocysteine methyltransferase